MNILDFVIAALFAVSALLAVFRIVRGPSILDRMIASDVLLTTLILVIGTEMVFNHHTRNIPMMVVLAGTAVFATIAVARYVSKQDLQTTQEPNPGQAEQADPAEKTDPAEHTQQAEQREADA